LEWPPFFVGLVHTPMLACRPNAYRLGVFSFMANFDAPRDPDIIPLDAAWSSAFERLADILRSIVRSEKIAVRQSVAIAKLLFATERLPSETKGVAIEVSLTERTDDNSTTVLSYTHSGYRVQLYTTEMWKEAHGCEHSTTVLVDAEAGCSPSESWRIEGWSPLDVRERLENWLNQWEELLGSSHFELSVEDDEQDSFWNQPMLENGWDILAEMHTDLPD